MMYQQRNRKNTIIKIAVALVVLIAFGTAGYFAKSYYSLRSHPGSAAEDDTKRLVSAVGKLYQLPSDETPIAGKVRDKEKLKDQPFFQKAENNDDILIYQKAKVAIIYRAGENRLINVGPIAINAAQETKP